MHHLLATNKQKRGERQRKTILLFFQQLQLILTIKQNWQCYNDIKFKYYYLTSSINNRFIEFKNVEAAGWWGLPPLQKIVYCANWLSVKIRKKKLHVDVKQNNKYIGYLKALPIVTILAFCFWLFLIIFLFSSLRFSF